MLTCLLLLSPAARAAEEPVVLAVGQIQIVGWPPAEAEIDGVRTTEARPAAEKLAAALDRLLAVHPMSVDAIDRLLERGRIEIAYDARHPPDVMTEVNIATFLPHYYAPEEGRRVFLVLVGRTGIQWSVDHLAAALAHELAGHAIQRLEGRIGEMRLLDAECEAYLIDEDAAQALDLDKTARERVEMRRAMESRWCDDFRRWTLENAPQAAEQWNERDPDIRVLLKAFERYSNAS
jgi:hypothetical protein